MKDNNSFQREVERALEALRAGGVILYPTDTVWGLGCNALEKEAIHKIYKIKQRDEGKSLIILVGDERDILKYVAAPDISVFNFIREQKKPTTLIFEGAVGLPENLIAGDGSIGIRIVQDEFCRHVIKRLKAPLVSTSANISGEPAPQIYTQIADSVKQQVDYIVQWRHDDQTIARPSQIIKWEKNGSFSIIRP